MLCLILGHSFRIWQYRKNFILSCTQEQRLRHMVNCFISNQQQSDSDNIWCNCFASQDMLEHVPVIEAASSEDNCSHRKLCLMGMRNIVYGRHQWLTVQITGYVDIKLHFRDEISIYIWLQDNDHLPLELYTPQTKKRDQFIIIQASRLPRSNKSVLCVWNLDFLTFWLKLMSRAYGKLFSLP